MPRSFQGHITLLLSAGMLLPAGASADVITLSNGSQISGTVESGTAQDIRIRSGGRLQMIAVERIQSIRFDPQTPAPAVALARIQALPAGTDIVVRTIDRIESKKADSKREYQASLDEPLAVDGTIIAPMNSEAILRVSVIADADIKGRSSLSLQLTALIVNGKRIAIATDDGSTIAVLFEKPVKIQPGTRLTFRLSRPVVLP
jgi:urease accessory protein UreE